MINNNGIKVKPFLKWVGGKSQLISTIKSFLPYDINQKKSISKYFEPFVGGGALFFYFMSEFNVKNSYISDTNEDLILTYKVIQKDPKKLIKILYELKSEFIPLDYDKRKIIYYDITDNFNFLKKEIVYDKYSNDHILQAANLLFLNKTCFNGIYRVNSKGYFNVPIGRYKNPLICDKDNILNISNILKNTKIVNLSYEFSEKHITKNSFVYLDPPYRPITETSFTSYTKSNFNDKNQVELSEFYKRISKKGAYVLLSNSDPKNKDINDNFFEDLYGDFKIDRIQAKRYINSDGNNRGPINEILVRNYSI